MISEKNIEIASAADDGYIFFWNLDSPKDNKYLIHKENQGIFELISLKQQNQNILISCGTDRTIKFWSLETNKLIKELEVTAMASSLLLCEGNVLISGHGAAADNLIYWDMTNYKMLKKATPHKNMIMSMAKLGKDKALAAIGYMDGLIQIYDVEKEKVVKELIGHEKSVVMIKFNEKTPNWLYSFDSNDVIRLWDWEKGICLETYESLTMNVNGLALTLKNQLIVFGCPAFNKEKTNAIVLNAENLELEKTLEIGESIENERKAFCWSFLEVEKLLLFGTNGGYIFFVDKETFKTVGKSQMHLDVCVRKLITI